MFKLRNGPCFAQLISGIVKCHVFVFGDDDKNLANCLHNINECRDYCIWWRQYYLWFVKSENECVFNAKSNDNIHFTSVETKWEQCLYSK